MSGFFALLSAAALVALIVFIVLARKKRPGAGKKAWIALAAMFAFSALSGATETQAEKTARAAREAAEVQAQEKADADRAAAERKAEAERQASQAAAAKAEAARRAMESIDEADLIVACERYVRSRLKLPDTARFPGVFDENPGQAAIGPKGAVYRAWVESENSFGGTVRSEFTCMYQKSDNTISAQISER